MPLVTVTNNTTIDQTYVDINGFPVIVAPGRTVNYEAGPCLPHDPDAAGLTVLVDTDGAGTELYRGYALVGSPLSYNAWAIKKRIALGGGDYEWRWVQQNEPGIPKMIFVWNLRTTYTYV